MEPHCLLVQTLFYVFGYFLVLTQLSTRSKHTSITKCTQIFCHLSVHKVHSRCLKSHHVCSMYLLPWIFIVHIRWHVCIYGISQRLYILCSIHILCWVCAEIYPTFFPSLCRSFRQRDMNSVLRKTRWKRYMTPLRITREILYSEEESSEHVRGFTSQLTNKA